MTAHRWLCLGALVCCGLVALCGVLLVATIIFAPQGFLVIVGAGISAFMLMASWVTDKTPKPKGDEDE